MIKCIIKIFKLYKHIAMLYVCLVNVCLYITRTRKSLPLTAAVYEKKRSISTTFLAQICLNTVYNISYVS